MEKKSNINLLYFYKKHVHLQSPVFKKGALHLLLSLFETLLNLLDFYLLLLYSGLQLQLVPLVFFHATGCEAHLGLQNILGGTFHTVDISISKSKQHQAPQPRMLETTAVMGFPNVHVFALSPQGSSPSICHGNLRLSTPNPSSLRHLSTQFVKLTAQLSIFLAENPRMEIGRK